MCFARQYLDKYYKGINMNINTHSIFIYEIIHHVTVSDGCFCLEKDNGNMHKNPIKVHRGIDNKVIFRALQPDRTVYNIACDQEVYARIIDNESRKIVKEKKCTTGPAKGVIALILDSGDLAPIPPGTYSMVLIRRKAFVEGQANEHILLPIYTDRDNNITMAIEVTEQAEKYPRPETIILPENWTPDLNIKNEGPLVPSFYTKSIPGARVNNHIDSVHTFSTYTEKFTGTLEIWATLEETPSPYLDRDRWFKIFPSTMSQDIEFINYTGTQAWSFVSNFMWIRFRYVPSSEVADPGTLAKLIVRA